MKTKVSKLHMTAAYKRRWGGERRRARVARFHARFRKVTTALVYTERISV